MTLFLFSYLNIHLSLLLFHLYPTCVYKFWSTYVLCFNFSLEWLVDYWYVLTLKFFSSFSNFLLFYFILKKRHQTQQHFFIDFHIYYICRYFFLSVHIHMKLDFYPFFLSLCINYIFITIIIKIIKGEGEKKSLNKRTVVDL